MQRRSIPAILAILLAMAFVGPAVARAATIFYVDDDAPGDPGPGDPNVSDPLEDGSPDHPFDRIQEAIDAASSGDAVSILAGTYTENVTVYDARDISLTGAGRGVTILKSDSGTTLGEAADFNLFGGTQIDVASMTLIGPVRLAGHFSTRLRDLDMPAFSVEGSYLGSLGGGSLEIDDATAVGGGVSMSGGASAGLTIRNLTAPTSSVSMEISDGFPFLNLSDSVVSSVDLHGGLSVFGGLRSVHITGDGLFAMSGQASSLFVSDCAFDGGGIVFFEYADPESNWDGDFSVTGTTFAHDGVYFDTSGSPGVSPAEKAVTISGNSFHGDGARVSVFRRPNDDVGVGATSRLHVTAVNNVLWNAGIEATLDYGSPAPTGMMGRLLADLHVVNNTIAGAPTGAEVTVGDHVAGIDQVTTSIRNNVISFGQKGIRIDGTTDQTVTVHNNDLFGNNSANYMGRPDPTALN